MSMGDDNQKPSFSKKLCLQGFCFDLKAYGNGSLQTLKIKPTGLKLKNSNKEIILSDIDKVSNAEIEDLDSDGFPEILIYTKSAGSGSYGNVIGYSVNKGGKSLSQISFPDIYKDSKASKGYMGHDEFAIVETTFCRRFKEYNDTDSNAKPTGKTKQIQYKLKNGEASKKFVIDKILEF